jgi:hypothetical protein
MIDSNITGDIKILECNKKFMKLLAPISNTYLKDLGCRIGVSPVAKRLEARTKPHPWYTI